MQRSAFFGLALFLALRTFAGGPISWTFTPITAANGQEEVQLQALCEQGWHIYALTLPRDDGPFPTVIRVNGSADFEMAGNIVEPDPEEVEDPNFMMLVRYHAGEVVFSAPIKRMTNAAFAVEGEVEFMCCNDNMCLPPEIVKFSVPFPSVK